MADRSNRFYARSASDKTDDWTCWFVADGMQIGLNVTANLETIRDGYSRLDAARFSERRVGAFSMQPFLPPYDAAKLARFANEAIGDKPLSMAGAHRHG